MRKVIRIGTRDSELALWQAKTVQKKIEELGLTSDLVPVKSDGDLKLDQPLYELGITGIFTKTLDIALLNNQIDIAVHSMKDVPTSLPKGIIQIAVLERASSQDLLVHKGTDFLNGKGVIATGSLRRKAQWLHKYPSHKVVDLRGNVNTRLIKLIESEWDAAIFAKAGLERVSLLPKDAIDLDWMIPAPSQGAMVVMGRADNKQLTDAINELNDGESDICTKIERDFLKTLEGGCSAPIGAIAEINEQTVYFKGCLHSVDGKQEIKVEKNVALSKVDDFGQACANEVLANGGGELMEKIKYENRLVN